MPDTRWNVCEVGYCIEEKVKRETNGAHKKTIRERKKKNKYF